MDQEIILKKAVHDNKNQLASTSDIINMAMQFQQLFMMYESAIKQVKTQFEILEDEFASKHERKPISSISSRIKEPMSIAEKLQRKGLPITIDNMVTRLFDIAGIRITCPFISDVYRVLHILETLDDIEIIEQKDYIKNPKKSGYRSLHVVVKVRVSFSDEKRAIPVEIQIRTIAMDFWASLEHQIHYKKDYSMPENVAEELRAIAETIHDTDKRMQNLAEYLPDFVDYEKEYK
ncbi:MAG: GTP pyrophosphokinase family protein [Treponema sp.]|nr:GTP pyrophosphokinase family protein [Treponema sp.]